MDTLIENRIDVKLFLGCLFTSEIRMYLFQNIAWKQAKITPEANPLVEIRYEGKDYLGKYLPTRSLTLKQVQKADEEILDAIRTFCPQLNHEALKLFIFPQIFIK